MIGRIFSAALLIATGCAGSALAAGNPCKSGADAPRDKPPGNENFQYSSNDTEIVVHRGRHSKAVLRGFSHVDDPAVLHCESATGCLLVIHAQVFADTTGNITCTYVDGHAIDGRWAVADSYSGVPDFSDTIVSAGDHKVHTKLWAYNPGTLYSWAITYTMYDQRSGPRSQ